MSSLPQDPLLRPAWAWRRYRRHRWGSWAAVAVATACLIVVVAQWDRFGEGTVALAVAVPILPGALWAAWHQAKWARLQRAVAQTAEAAVADPERG